MNTCSRNKSRVNSVWAADAGGRLQMLQGVSDILYWAKLHEQQRLLMQTGDGLQRGNLIKLNTFMLTK